MKAINIQKIYVAKQNTLAQSALIYPRSMTTLHYFHIVVFYVGNAYLHVISFVNDDACQVWKSYHMHPVAKMKE